MLCIVKVVLLIVIDEKCLHVVREVSIDILVNFVGRSISVGKYVVQYKLWDCRMEHVVLEAKNCPFRYDFDYKLDNF